jgi:hypothetical protein
MICGMKATSNDFVWMNGSGNQLSYRNGTNNTASRANSLFTTLADYAIVYDFSAQQITMYKDGAVLTAAVSFTSSADLDIDTIMGGYTQAANRYALVGDLHYLYIWDNRALDATEVGEIHTDPYAFLIAPPGLTLTAPVRVWQRSGSGIAISLAGSYGDAAGDNVQARVLLEADDSVVVDWTTVDSSLSANAWSGTITTPMGGPYYVEVRLRNSGGTVIATADDLTNTIIVGDVFVAIGQSNTDGRLTNNQTYTGTAPCWLFRDSGTLDTTLNDPWSDGATGGSWGPILATLLDAHLGGTVPLCFVVYAVGGTGLVTPANWSGATFTAAAAMITGLGLNGFKAVLWLQGESDAINAVSKSAYQSAEVTLANAVNAWAGSPVLISSLLGEQAITAANLDAINAAKIANWDAGETEPGAVFVDLNLTDNLHLKTDADGATYAGRLLQAIKEQCYSTGTARGPVLDFAVSSGSTLTLTFDKDLNASDTTYTTTLFTVSHSGTARTVNAAARSGSRDVVLTLSGALDGSSPTVTFASGQTAVGATMPRSPTVALPVTVNTISEVTLPAEPFFAVAVTIPSVNVTFPISTDRRIVGTAENITWTSDGFSGTVDILISTNNGSSFSSLAAGQTNDGTYSWTPTSGQIGSQVIIRVRSTDDTDVYDDSAAFIVATTEATGGGTNTALWFRLQELAIADGLELLRP